MNQFKENLSTITECIQRKFDIRTFSLIFFAIAYFFRRPADALYPAVWAEDGLLNLPMVISNPWEALFAPINGYLQLPLRLISIASMSISGLFYPEISYFLTFLTTISVLFLLTSQYFTFKGKYYLPIVIALLPYNPEVFSTPLYIFWWTTLLLLIPLFLQVSLVGKNWKTYLVTISCLSLGILSSPICIVLFPIMVFKLFINRERLDYILLGIWALLSTYQLRLSLLSSASKPGHSLQYADLRLVIPKYFGNFFFHGSFLSEDTIWIYLVFLVFIAVGILTTIKILMRRDINLLPISISFFMVFAAIATSTIRLGNFLPDPIFAGPRYFFFPYIFLSLFLISIAVHTRNFLIKGSCILVLISACTLTWKNDFSRFYRIHDPLSWRAELSACLQSPEPYQLKIHSDGNPANYWRKEYTYEECDKIANSGILAQIFGLDRPILEGFK